MGVKISSCFFFFVIARLTSIVLLFDKHPENLRAYFSTKFLGGLWKYVDNDKGGLCYPTFSPLVDSSVIIIPILIIIPSIAFCGSLLLLSFRPFSRLFKATYKSDVNIALYCFRRLSHSSKLRLRL